jgi:hypothetical protein
MSPAETTLVSPLIFYVIPGLSYTRGHDCAVRRHSVHSGHVPMTRHSRDRTVEVEEAGLEDHAHPEPRLSEPMGRAPFGASINQQVRTAVK